MLQNPVSVETQVTGPDGQPAVFEGGAWVSQDRRYWWNGAAWLPMRKPGAASPWLMRTGVWLLFAALVGYVLYTTFTAASAYTIGFYVGVIAFFAVVFVVFRFVGRWGWVGVVIRAGCAGLALLKILTLITHPPPT